MSAISQRVAQIVHLTRQSGSLAPDHALAVAGNILEARPLPPEFTRLAPALIRQAATIHPFERENVRLAADINKQTSNPVFGKWLEQAIRLNAKEPVPDITPYPDTTTATADDYVEYLENQGANVERLPVLMHLWHKGEKDALIRAIRIMAASASGLLAGPLLAWGAYGAGETVLAEMLLDEGVDNYMGLNLRARMALDDGQPDLAMTHLVMSLDHEPFQPGMVELMAELATAKPLPTPGPDTHICLYTWNKPDLLTQTMESLAGTSIGHARVTILNNGTTTCSPEEMEARIRKAAPNVNVNFVHLPVNIGAPAARNWLLELPEVRQSKYVAFLDDDVILPKNWLRRYIATLGRFPEAVAVGPKCVNRDVRTIQYAFRSFEEIGENRIRFSANAPSITDTGLFDAARPSLTVMGCCHLFDRAKLDTLGVPGFDIRFSPSQVDDIEHDLQIWKAGGQVVYDGGVPVVHLQDTGTATNTNRAAMGQAYANHFKMESKFTADELKRMHGAVTEADRAHFRTALATAMTVMTDPARKFWKMTGACL